MSASPIPVELLLEELPKVRRMARALVGEALADDVAQETMRIALQAPPRGDAAPGAWIGGILRNVARGTRRAEARRRERERECAVAGSGEGEGEGRLRENHAEALELLGQALQRLNEEDRRLLVARFLEEVPPRKLAAQMGLPPGTLRSRLSRALTKLRQAMTALGGDRAFGLLVTLGGFSLGTAGVASAQAALRQAPGAKATTAAAGISLAAAAALTVGVLTQVGPWSREDPASSAIEARHESGTAMGEDTETRVSGTEAGRQGEARSSPYGSEPSGAQEPRADPHGKADAGGPGAVRRDPITTEAVPTTRRVQVVDQEGVGIPDVELRTIASDSEEDLQMAWVRATQAGRPLPGTIDASPAVFSDENGYAEVPVVEGLHMGALPRKPGYLAVSARWAAAGEETQLMMYPTRSLPVRVLDAEGRPAVGVEVAVSASGAVVWRNGLLLTDHEGRITLLGFGASADAVWKGGGEVAVAARPVGEDHAVTFAGPEDVPSEVELRLPPCGRIRVDTGVPGADGVIRLSLGDGGIEMREPQWTGSVVDGVADFPWVLVGEEEYRLDVYLVGESGARRRGRVAAPRSAGELVELDLGLRSTPTLVGRLHLPNGEALVTPPRGRDVEFSLLREGLSTGTSLVTTRDGSFRFVARENERQVPIESLRFRYLDYILEVPLGHALDQGVTDLGDLTLTEVPALLTGEVVDEEGLPIEDYRVTVQLVSQRSRGREYVHSSSAPVRRDEGNRFRVLPADHEEFFDALQVRATAPGRVMAEPVRVEPGATGVRLVLSAAGMLRGEVRAPSAEYRRGLEVHVVQSDDPEAERLKVRLLPSQAEDPLGLLFDFAAVAPGQVDLEFYLQGFEEPVHRIQGLGINPGAEVEDPRLKDLDASAWVREIVVEARATEGAEAPAQPTWFAMHESGYASVESMKMEDGRYRLMVPKEGIPRIGVSAEGYVFMEREVLGDEAVFVLSRRRMLRITIAGNQELSFNGNPLGMKLDRVPPSPSMRSDRVDMQEDWADRATTVEIDGPGKYQVEWMLYGKVDRNAFQIAASKTSQVTIREEHLQSGVLLDPPAGLWEAAEAAHKR